MTNIGKPYEGKPHVRFDEERLAAPAFHSTILCSRRQGKPFFDPGGRTITRIKQMREIIEVFAYLYRR